MKKLFFLAICTLVAFAAKAERSPDADSDNPRWQEAVDKAVGFVGCSADKELRLLGYSYIGKLEDTQAIADAVDAMFADDAMIAIPFGPGFSQFVVLPVGEVQQRFELPAPAAERYADQKNRLKTALEPGMEALSLHWSYDGREFSSTAIVADADRFFVYDNIASYIVSATKTDAETVTTQTASGAEIGTNTETTTTIRTYAPESVR